MINVIIRRLITFNDIPAFEDDTFYFYPSAGEYAVETLLHAEVEAGLVSSYVKIPCLEAKLFDKLLKM